MFKSQSFTFSKYNCFFSRRCFEDVFHMYIPPKFIYPRPASPSVQNLLVEKKVDVRKLPKSAIAVDLTVPKSAADEIHLRTLGGLAKKAEVSSASILPRTGYDNCFFVWLELASLDLGSVHSLFFAM